MSAAQAMAIVDAYLDAIASHDYERARAWLADTGFRYGSPIASFSDPDDFIQHLSLSAGIVQRMETLKSVAEGQDVCHFLRFVVQISDKEAVTVAQWARVEDGRIRHLELVFDAHLYRRMFDVPSLHP